MDGKSAVPMGEMAEAAPASGSATAAVPAGEIPTLSDILPAMRQRRVFEAQAEGPIHTLLARLPGYVCSEYLPNEVLVNDAISRLVAVYQQHGTACGTLGCRLHYENNAVQHAGIQLLAEGGALRLTHRGIGTFADFAQIERGTLGNTGAFLMIRRDLFEQMGGFDEGYRDCYQDVALNLECILAGHENFFDGSAVAYHYESQTRSRRIPPEDGARLAAFLHEHPDPRITRLITHRPAE